MSNELHLGTGWFGCSVDALRGARLSSLRVAGRERLVTHSRGASPTSWGAYPMVPYAGRVRRGKFQHAGQEHQLPLNFGHHAIHGTVFDVSWATVEQSPTRVVLAASLGARWPFAGHVTHEISLNTEQQSVNCTLEVTTSESMPAQVGWHPWLCDRLGSMSTLQRCTCATPTTSRPHNASLRRQGHGMTASPGHVARQQ